MFKYVALFTGVSGGSGILFWEGGQHFYFLYCIDKNHIPTYISINALFCIYISARCINTSIVPLHFYFKLYSS